MDTELIAQRYMDLAQESSVAFPGGGLDLPLPEQLHKGVSEGYLCVSWRGEDSLHKKLLLDMVAGAGFADRFHDGGPMLSGHLEVRFRPQYDGQWFATEEPLKSSAELLEWAGLSSFRAYRSALPFAERQNEDASLRQNVMWVVNGIQNVICRSREGFPRVGGLKVCLPSDFEERRAFVRFLRGVGFGFVLSEPSSIGVRWEPTTHPTLGLPSIIPGEADRLFSPTGAFL